MGKSLEGFQTQVAGRLTGPTEGKWRYTAEAVARKEAGFLTMEEYVRGRQDTVA